MNYGDYLNADELYNRMTELETDLGIYLEDNEDAEGEFDDIDELEMLREACETIEMYKGSGELLISEDKFVEYTKEVIKECYGIDVPDFVEIDWDSTADNLKIDYVDVEIDGTTYYFRAG